MTDDTDQRLAMLESYVIREEEMKRKMKQVVVAWVERLKLREEQLREIAHALQDDMQELRTIGLWYGETAFDLRKSA